MEISGEALSATAPSLHSLDKGKERKNYSERSEKGEKQPLLEGSDGKKRQLFIKLGRLSQWNWKNLITAAILWLAYLSASAAYSIIGPFFPNEAAEKGSTSTLTGIIISCSPLCVVILSPLIGYFVSDLTVTRMYRAAKGVVLYPVTWFEFVIYILPQLGLKFTLLSGLWLIGGAFILLGFVASLPSGWVFVMFCILLRFTEGTGSAMFITSVFTLLPELFPDSVGTVSGLMEMGGGLGFAIGPPIGGALYAIGGFKLPFLVVGATCLAFLPLIFLLVPKSDCKKQVLSLRTLVKLLTNFIIFLLVIASILSLAALAFFTPTLQPFLYGQFHLNEEHIGLVFLSGPATYMVVSLVVGKLSDKFGPRWFIIVGFLIEGVAYFFVGPADFIAQPKVWITVVAFGFIGLGAALGIVPIYLDMLNIAKSMGEDSDAIVGVVSGISSSTLSLGEFIGPLIGGALTEVMDFQTSAMVFGEVFLAEGALILGATLIDQWCGT